MLIIVKFKNNKITASTELCGVKKYVRMGRDYNFGTSMNADIAVEKLVNKVKEFGQADIEFVRESTNDGYVYISLTQMTDRSVITSNW